jgi:transcriptional regulator with XRE-family HTH domain
VDGFAERLKQMRKAKGWTRYRLAKESGVTQQALRLLEQRGSNPKLSTLYKLAAAFGVEIAELLPPQGEYRRRRPSGKRR